MQSKSPDITGNRKVLEERNLRGTDLHKSTADNHPMLGSEYLIVQQKQRDWTSCVGLAIGAFALGTLLSIFYTVVHAVMAHLTAIIGAAG